MQECDACGLLFGGAEECPSCGSRVSHTAPEDIEDGRHGRPTGPLPGDSALDDAISGIEGLISASHRTPKQVLHPHSHSKLEGRGKSCPLCHLALEHQPASSSRVRMTSHKTRLLKQHRHLNRKMKIPGPCLNRNHLLFFKIQSTL